jgi:ABC-type Zn uptake system ZnuABC Zn-binding protein ZnuA
VPGLQAEQVKRRLWPLVPIALAVAVLGACTGSASPDPGVVTVVTTTTVFADLVARVGGSRVDVHALVPRGADVHTFDPAPADARAISTAKLIVMNGLGLDDWLIGVVRDAGATNTPLLQLGDALPGADLIAADASEGGDTNPHLWMDVKYARGYAALIAAQLAAVDPAGKPGYDANLAAYDLELASLDTSIRAQFAALPAESRRVVSFHDAFPYFARAYGLEIIGVIVPAPGQDPSAGEIAALIQAIRDSHVKAVLSEAQFDDRLVRTIADETGAKVVSDLYDDSLGDPPIDSYVEMMKWDADKLTQALK